MARIRLGDLLIRAGLIDEMQLHSALALQRQWGGKLGDVLVNNGFLDEMMLYRGLSKQLGVTLVSLPDERFSPGVEAALPVDLCQKHSLVPVSRDDKALTLATSDPNNVGGIDEVSFRAGTRVRIVMAPEREVEWAIRRLYFGERGPCPPPRTKRVDSSAPAPVAAAPSTTSMPSPATSNADLAAMAARLAAATQTQTPWWSQATSSEAEEAVRETAHLLRFLVEACVQRGIFTREQYLARLRATE